MTEDEMVREHHQLNGHKSEQTPGDREGQGSPTAPFDNRNTLPQKHTLAKIPWAGSWGRVGDITVY